MKGAEKLLATRRDLVEGVPIPTRKAEGEGGCGVLGVASSRPVEGRHILRAMGRMRNRGNGKGGGIAAAGLRADELGESEATLRNDYLVQSAYLDSSSRSEVERSFLEPVFEVDHRAEIPVRGAGQAAPPLLVWRYFCRPRREAIERFASEHGLEELPEEAIADELVYRTSYLLNRSWYFSLGDKRAFVLCHGKDLVVFKVVGYAEDVIAAYELGHLSAHVWIGHQRYPTKGRVWHPGGAHPFVGLHEALVHNGDFANYHAISEYLAQRNVRPLFLTDTEVAVLLFDLWTRVYGYPLEYAIEALAPTTERDFELLSPERRAVYRAIQAAHIHGRPTAPGFSSWPDPSQRKAPTRSWGSRTRRCSGRRCSPSTGGLADRPRRLGAAGDPRLPRIGLGRTRGGLPGARSGLGRPGRQPHGRRGVRLPTRAAGRGGLPAPRLYEQVRSTRRGRRTDGKRREARDVRSPRGRST